MPAILSFLLSLNVVFVLLFIYVISALIIFIGFVRFNIPRRMDVKIRTFLMAATYIVASHGIGIILYSFYELYLKVSEITAGKLLNLGSSLLFSAITYFCEYILLNYLFSRLYIEGKSKNGLMISFSIIFFPYYFIVNGLFG
ncbi:MAG: hypothetical protein JW708_04440 [Vallitaleaceae bacterium]|nr:hypothetical protein [Vallitaleaceae bacterium]